MSDPYRMGEQYGVLRTHVQTLISHKMDHERRIRRLEVYGWLAVRLMFLFILWAGIATGKINSSDLADVVEEVLWRRLIGL